MGSAYIIWGPCISISILYVLVLCPFAIVGHNLPLHRNMSLKYLPPKQIILRRLMQSNNSSCKYREPADNTLLLILRSPTIQLLFPTHPARVTLACYV